MRRCRILILTALVFIALIGLSMIFYPGGSISDRSSLHYSFTQNFVSDLGSKFTPSGKQNITSEVLYKIAFGVLGIVLVFYSRIWRGLDENIHSKITLGFLSKACLILSGGAFIGMAFSPWDHFYDLHVRFEKAAFGFLLLWCIFITVIQTGNEKMRSLVVANSFFILFLAVFDYLLIAADVMSDRKEPGLSALFSNLILVLTAFNLIYQSNGILRFLLRADFRRSGPRDFYV